MKGKWAKGIAPRFFAWIIKDKLAVSERPGGYARNHRRVRRQEEILWLRGEGFTRVVSLLTSPHNLHAYDELEMSWAHIPFGAHDDPHLVLPDLYAQLRDWMASGERLLVHHEELSDRLMGVVAGYLRWSGLVPAGPQAITVVERIMHRQMGPEGRELVAMAPQLAGAGGCAGAPVPRRGRVSENHPRPREPLVAKMPRVAGSWLPGAVARAASSEAAGFAAQAGDGSPPTVTGPAAEAAAADSDLAVVEVADAVAHHEPAAAADVGPGADAVADPDPMVAADDPEPVAADPGPAPLADPGPAPLADPGPAPLADPAPGSAEAAWTSVDRTPPDDAAGPPSAIAGAATERDW